MNLIDALKTKRNILAKFSYTTSVTGNSPGLIDREYFLCRVLPELCEYDLLRDDWEVEPKPKKKVKRWLWAFYTNGTWAISSAYCSYEELADCWKKDDRIRNVKKLEWSETEFEE